MSSHRTLRRWLAGIAVGAMVVVGTVGVQAASSAHPSAVLPLAQCRGNPWTSAAYQAASSPAALASQVLGCLKLEDPGSYRHDEVGIVGLVHDGRFQNVNEFGVTSTVQHDLARLGIPPITLEDGPGGLIVGSNPKPTVLPNELALGATFDPSVAAQYGTLLGGEAHDMGYDGVQAPDLNLLRVPSWGRAMESFGESPVLAGELGASEAEAIAAQGEIPVLKHFGPYSQETDRHALDQVIGTRAYQEVYLRPFTMVLHALAPLLESGHHAIGVMCSYGEVNATKACRTPTLTRLLGHLGVDAFARSDLDVGVQPTQLLLNSIDLIKPLESSQLQRAAAKAAVGRALDLAVEQVFATEFADGLVNGKVTRPTFHPLSSHTTFLDAITADQIEQRAAVLLKDDALLPLRRGDGPIAVLGDPRVRNTCRNLASVLANDLATTAFCEDPHVQLPRTVLLPHIGYAHGTTSATATFTPKATGTYVAAVTTYDTTRLTMDDSALVVTDGPSEFGVQRTAQVQLRRGVRYRIRLSWTGLPPALAFIDEQPMLDAAVGALRGVRAAVVIAYDLTREGMDRSSLALPNAQDALISSVAASTPTAVLLATDGAVTMPWLNQVRSVLEVWNPTGMVYTDATLSRYVDAYGNLLDGTVDPSGRLPETFPTSQSQSPMSVHGFWPGNDGRVNLDLAPYDGLGIGYDWYRTAGWPVLFPFGYGLSYTTYQLLGGHVTDPSTGLQVTVSVRDTGAVAGTQIVQIYADWPSALGEPPDQLVGFAPVTFSQQDAARRTIRRVTIPISPTALSIFLGNGLTILPGSYCLEAATYDGDPNAWTSGSVTLAPGPGGSVSGPSTRLSPGTCPA